MANNANTARLKRMHNRAKALVRLHPNMKYQSALKKAGQEVRTGKKVSGTKKRKPMARRVGVVKKKRVGTAPKYKVIHEVRRIGNIADTRRKYKKQLEDKLAWELLAKESAKGVRERKKKAAKIAETKKELRAVGGLKKGKRRR